MGGAATDRPRSTLPPRALLLRNALFRRLLQALIELAAAGPDERSLLEALSNHVATRAAVGYHQAELLTG